MKTTLSVLVLSALLTFVSGCSITRYYKVPDVNGQIGAMNSSIDTNVAKMNSDYESKRTLLDGAKKSGANLSDAPFSNLASLLQEMKAAKEAAAAKATAAQNEALSLSKSIAGKDRVTSEEPQYEQVKNFGKRGEKLNEELTTVFARYTDRSNAFVRVANENKVFPVDVANFDGQLKNAMGEIDRQCGEVEAKIVDVEKKISTLGNVPKKEERLSLLAGMHGDVKAIQATKADLDAFRKSFQTVSKGQKTLIVGPHLPHFELFQSFSSVQEKMNQAVAGFNGKVAAYNKL